MALTNSGLDVTLTPMQSRVHRCGCRFRVCICGRRGGKTWYDNAWLIEGAVTKPRSVNWFVGTTVDDARKLFYQPVLDLLPRQLVGRVNGTQLEITLVNGSTLKGLGSEVAKRGRGVDRLVCDEFAWWNNWPETWQGELRPALSDRLGQALFTTTPAGFNHAYDLYMRGLSDDAPDWAGFQWTTVEGGQVTAEEVEAARADMDPRIFAQEYLAGFTSLSGRVYSNFDRLLNVEPVEDQGNEVYVGIDFNVNPMSAVVASKAADEVHVWDEIELLSSNTDELVDEIKHRYPNRRIVTCPDPSGRARKTSAAGQTDFTIIRRAGLELRAPNSAPLVRDRVNNTQAALLSADGRRRLKVHPRCHKLIKALDGLTYKADSNVPDKNSGLDHITDALGYMLWELTPMHSRTLQIGHFSV